MMKVPLLIVGLFVLIWPVPPHFHGRDAPLFSKTLLCNLLPCWSTVSCWHGLLRLEGCELEDLDHIHDKY